MENEIVNLQVENQKLRNENESTSVFWGLNLKAYEEIENENLSLEEQNQKLRNETERKEKDKIEEEKEEIEHKLDVVIEEVNK